MSKTETVSVAQFKARLSELLARARAGHVISITSHRKLVARVTGIPEEAGRGVAPMLAAGRMTHGGGRKPEGADVRLPMPDASLADTILEDRGPS